jgi:hypothetical protein
MKLMTLRTPGVPGIVDLIPIRPVVADPAFLPRSRVKEFGFGCLPERAPQKEKAGGGEERPEEN